MVWPSLSMLQRLKMGRRFYLLWGGESAALLGAALVQFALGVWVYRHTGSVVNFAAVIISAAWPPVLILPFAGGLADLVDRRYLILGADLFLALMIALLAILLALHRLTPSHLYIFNSLAAIAGSLRKPAYQVAVSTLLDKDDYIRAIGLIGLTRNLCSIAAPPLAAALMATTGLSGILGINLICFVLGMVLVLKALFGARMPTAARTAERRFLLHESLRQFSQGIAFFKSNRLLGGLLFYVVIQSSLLALATLMITPLVLASHTNQQLGFVYACGALGGLAGALLMIVLRNPRRLMVVLVGADALLSACVLCSGVTDVVVAYCALAFMAIAAAGVAEGCANALWMRKTELESRGSVFALTGTLSLLTLSIVMMGGGFIVDRVLEPSFTSGGFLEQYLGGWFGTGKRAPIALLFAVSGTLGLLMCSAMLANRKLRQLDVLVPDGTVVIEATSGRARLRPQARAL